VTEEIKNEKVTFTIEGKEYQANYGESLLYVLRQYGYDVPSLCYHEAVSSYGACRLCLVEVKKGKRTKLTTSCNYPVQQGIEVSLDTEQVVKHRKRVLQLLLAIAPASEEVRELALEYGVDSTPFEAADKDNKCILCGLCARVCEEVVGAEAINFAGRGEHKKMIAPYDETAESCIGCAACVFVCPTNCIGLKEENNVRTIERWHRQLPMKTCAKCGVAYAPTFQLMHIEKQAKIDKALFETCPDCR
jgi:NADH dehydrogenase/NADH:ubiquinone oxidoreductase subunit G